VSISRARLEDITLHNYIKFQVLGLEFVESYTNQSLLYDNTTGLYRPSVDSLYPSPVSAGRGWVPFDEVSSEIITTSEQSSRISVIGASTYSVNYVYGGLKDPDTVPSSLSYTYHYVSVVDGWPGNVVPDLPVVAVDVYGQKRVGLQLGPGFISSRPVDLHIFGSTSSERDDLKEVLFDALYSKSIPVLDYSTGDYLTTSGYFDSSFTRAPVLEGPRMFFDNVSERNISNFVDWSDTNRYRAVVSFDLVVYKG